MLLALTQFLMMADRHLPSLVLSDLKATFELTDTRLGLLQGPAFVVVYVLATVSASRFIDRSPRAAVIAGAIIVWTLATVGFGLAQTWQQLLAWRIMLGIAQAVVAPTSLSWISLATAPGSLGRMVSLFTMGSALGRSGALLIGSMMLAAVATLSLRGGLDAWRWLFLLSALPNLIVAAALILRSGAAPKVPAPTTTLTQPWRSLMSHRSSGLPWVLAGACCVILVGQATAGWMPTALRRLADLSTVESGLIAGTIVLAGAPIGHLGGGFLVDRLHRRGNIPVWTCAAALFLAVPAAALLVVSGSVWTLGTGFLLIVVCAGAAASSALACFQSGLATGTHGAGSSAYLAAVNLIGLGIGPPLVGWLSDRVFGSDGLGQSIFVAVGLFGVVGTLAFLRGIWLWPRAEPTSPPVLAGP